jgi:hypothetical protein
MLDRDLPGAVTMHYTPGQYLELPPDDVLALIETEPAVFMQSPVAHRFSDPTTLSILRASLPDAQQLMANALPAFYAWLQRELGVTRVPDTPDHAIEWVIDFLTGRMQIDEFAHYHSLLSSHIIKQAAPQFIAIFDDLDFGRKQWQQATDLLSIALLAAAQGRERIGREQVKEQRDE